VEDLRQHYETMLIIRRFEEAVDRLFGAGELRGTSHLCVGQEAVPVGACAALRPDDLVVSNHRGHGHFIAKGGEPRRIMAELFGSPEGYSSGRGGSQHMACFELGFLGSFGITGGGIPIATGAALAAQYRKTGQVVVAFFGDGAANQGTFHESLNMAAIWRLPIVYLCENNLYAMSLPFRDGFAVPHVADRAVGYGMPGAIVDGNDVVAVRDAVAQAAERARAGDGPTLIEAKTYRCLGHSRGDPRVYRTREEERAWLACDPIARLGQSLRTEGQLNDAGEAEVNARVQRTIEDALAFARSGSAL
jgi:TPP-dependent pyruvate/acetoin dehydrogenase alpha subunit